MDSAFVAAKNCAIAQAEGGARALELARRGSVALRPRLDARRPEPPGVLRLDGNA